MEEGEAGVAGVVINLAQPADAVIANTTTDASGAYTFDGLAAGEYTVSAVAPEGWNLIAPAEGSYLVAISDANEVAKDFGLQRIAVPEVEENTTDNTTSSVTIAPAATETATNTTVA
jgi:beta-galactosidase GanA